MSLWRVVCLSMTLLALGGCLATFEGPLPGQQVAPAGLVGQWRSADAWGQPVRMTITQVADHTYQAKTQLSGKAAERHRFSVQRHGDRWYASVQAPQHEGRWWVLGFEMRDRHDLVVYSLDPQALQQAVASGSLQGQVTTAVEEEPQVDITTPAAQVQAYLDDPANSDVFVEAVRFQRVTP